MEPDFDVIIPVVVAVALLLVFVFIIMAVLRAMRRAAALVGGGMSVMVPGVLPGAPRVRSARGLVLRCDRVSFGVTVNGRRFERRGMTLDVEVAGQPPFVTTGDFLIPRGIVEALPGSSLELVLDGSNQITVLGPGGFTGPWLKAGPPNSY